MWNEAIEEEARAKSTAMMQHARVMRKTYRAVYTDVDSRS